MKTRAEYTCEDANSDFYLAEVDYNHSFIISCEKSLILGGKFPYWKVPGTDYPSKQEIFCAFPTECYNFPDVDPVMAPLGLTDTFDRVHIKNGETYEYVCSLDGNRGLISFLLYLLPQFIIARALKVPDILSSQSGNFSLHQQQNFTCGKIVQVPSVPDGSNQHYLLPDQRSAQFDGYISPGHGPNECDERVLAAHRHEK